MILKGTIKPRIETDEKAGKVTLYIDHYDDCFIVNKQCSYKCANGWMIIIGWNAQLIVNVKAKAVFCLRTNGENEVGCEIISATLIGKTMIARDIKEAFEEISNKECDWK